jgi:copper chaperone NosL
MNQIFIILLAGTLSLFSCSQEPKPINYGKDACDFCKMIIMDKRYAAEIVTTKGKAYKFDDILCEANFIHSGKVPASEIACAYIVDFNTSEFLNTKEAFFLKNETLRSPMGGNIAAFKTKEDLEAAQKKMKGELITWEEILKIFKQ